MKSKALVVPPVFYDPKLDSFAFVSQQQYDELQIIADCVVKRLKLFMGAEYKRFLDNEILPQVRQFHRHHTPERVKFAQAKLMGDV